MIRNQWTLTAVITFLTHDSGWGAPGASLPVAPSLVAGVAQVQKTPAPGGVQTTTENTRLLVKDEPIFFRASLQDSSPRSLAVGLPGAQNFCFDTALCRFRYAWAGGFLEVKPAEAALGAAEARILGQKYFTAPDEFPLRIGRLDKEPQVAFRGYRLVNKIPEFLYEVDGVLVRERTIPAKDGPGLTRCFDLDAVESDVWFKGGKGSRVTVHSLAPDILADGWCRVSGRNPLRFEVTIRPP